MSGANLYQIPVKYIDGKQGLLGDFAGKVLLIVNTASKCGFTPQYSELEALYRKHAAAGLVVLGFPCNQFGAQEPGDDNSVLEFCSTTYDVTFPMFSKIEVNGDNAHPLFRELKSRAKGLLGTEAVKWNFTKFLVDRSGAHVTRYAPGDTIVALEPAVSELLAQG
jgi:glutathione peroxidase